MISNEIVTINLMTMFMTFPECPQGAEGMHDPPPWGGLWWTHFERGRASLYVAGLGGAAMAQDKMFTCKGPLGSPSGTLVSSSYIVV